MNTSLNQVTGSKRSLEEDEERRGGSGRGPPSGGGGFGGRGGGGRSGAIFHLSVKSISRGKGRSATAASAYRSGEKIKCEREDKVHDYTIKGGIEDTGLEFPDDVEWIQTREQLWNAAEAAEVRRNAQVAREYEVAIPHQLSAEARKELVQGFAGWLVGRYHVAADWAIHAPNREGDQRNWHAHIMTTTREIGPEGFGAKTRILDVRQTSRVEVVAVREAWAVLSNRALRQEGHEVRVDHRSLGDIAGGYMEQRQAAQAKGDEAGAERYGLLALQHERRPQRHVGVHATGMDRRVRHDPDVMSDNGLERQHIQAAAEANEERVKARADRLQARGVMIAAGEALEDTEAEKAKHKAKLAEHEAWSPLGGAVRRGEQEQRVEGQEFGTLAEAEVEKQSPQQSSQKPAEDIKRESDVERERREATQEAQEPESQKQCTKPQRMR
jgi:MobA/MobL family